MHSLQKHELMLLIMTAHQLALLHFYRLKSKTNRTSFLGFSALFNYYYIKMWLIFKFKVEITSKKLLIMFLVAKLTLNLWIKMFLTISKKNTLGKIPETISENRMSNYRLLKTLFKKNVNKRRNGYWKLNNPH